MQRRSGQPAAAGERDAPTGQPEAGDAPLREAFAGLEVRIAERTEALSRANEQLQLEVQERARTEQALRYTEQLLRRMHDDLEHHIAERTAELTKTIDELEAFTYSVSHDLRAPLRAINGYAAILREEHARALAPPALVLLDRMEGNASKMAQLIDGLLDFSRLARARAPAEQVDMQGLVRTIVDEFAAEPSLVTDNDARLAAPAITIAALPSARGDPAMLRQVWTNLVSNALKFSRRAAPPVIEIGGERSGDELVYWVRDNGVGFDMTYVDQLFGIFQRLHPADEFPGVGVGLAVVRRIVQRHGGHVFAHSEDASGATFGFTLPVTAQP